MKLKMFTAGSLADALALVRQQLGPHAVILHTRTYKRGGFLGFRAHTVVEVTAGVGQRVGHPRLKLPIAAPPASNPPAVQALPANSANSLAQQPSAGDLIRRTYALAKAELARNNPPPPAALPVQPLPVAPASDQRLPHDQLAQEVQAVKRMVASVMRRQCSPSPTAAPPADLPGSLFDEYLRLLQQEVAEELAEEVVRKARQELSNHQLADPAIVRRILRQQVASLIAADDQGIVPGTAPDGRPRTVAFVGPTGVGKTTTIAKLAAQFKLKQQKRVELITLDTYRISAVDQLKTYADIIGVPLHVPTNLQQLHDLVSKPRPCDILLMDTAGRSQRDDKRLDQLQASLQAAQPHEVHLVLSSTCSQPAIFDAIERFSRIRTDSIILTKLDEAVSFGVLFNVARKVNKRLSYITTGQEVPHDIEVGRADRLAAMVLGEVGAE
ncbi:MAG: flagellar biosynthesis protein FlhF [Phycisphaeraceae bacterium]|nr:flagellar biosynthesis protein FlhF [Phycisphaeraceae bacterium]